MAPKTGAGPREAALSTLMRGIWTTFARTGNPRTATTGDWSPYSAADRAVLELGGAAGPARLVRAPREATRAIWDAVFAG